jgi:hypothetical protein
MHELVRSTAFGMFIYAMQAGAVYSRFFVVCQGLLLSGAWNGSSQSLQIVHVQYRFQVMQLTAYLQCLRWLMLCCTYVLISPLRACACCLCCVLRAAELLNVSTLGCKQTRM